jgi:hypothetical protein
MTQTKTRLDQIRLTNDRPDLSSERAPQKRQDLNFQNKLQTKTNFWSKAQEWS